MSDEWKQCIRLMPPSGMELKQAQVTGNAPDHVTVEVIWEPAGKAGSAPVKRDTPQTVSPGETVPACPECGSPMRLREKKDGTGKFYGCSTFPKCKGLRPVK